MSDISRFLEDLVRHREEMDARGLLVALYEFYYDHKSLFQSARENDETEARLSTKLKKCFSQKTTTANRPLTIPEGYWELFDGCSERDKDCLFELSLYKIAGQVGDHIEKNLNLYDSVKSLITSKNYILIPRQNTPWCSGDPRYNKSEDLWFEKIHIVPEWQGFQTKFFLLPSLLRKRMDHAIQRVQTPEGEQSVSRIAVWPVSKTLSFTVQPAPTISVDQSDRGQCVPFHLKNDEHKNWEEEVKPFRDYILPKCQEEKILVLILPELTVPPAFLSLLQKEMRNRFEKMVEQSSAHEDLICYPLLMVAGSFHVLNNENPQKHVNRTVVLDYRGGQILLQSAVAGIPNEERWSMDKLFRYQIEKSHIPNATALIHALGLNNPQVRHAREPDQLGRVLPVVYAGPRLGMMTVVICIDFLKGLKPWLNHFQGKGWVDWVFVPSASTETKPFSDANKEWSEKGVCTVVVNACWLLEQTKKWPGALFAQAGIPQGKTVSSDPDKPTNKRYFRWRFGNEETKQFSPQSPLPDDATTCPLSCGKCLAVLEVALDENMPDCL